MRRAMQVLSTVRSNSTGKLGFVKDKQRVCVAISRAMRQLVVVGDTDTLSHGDASWRTVCGESSQMYSIAIQTQYMYCTFAG